MSSAGAPEVMHGKTIPNIATLSKKYGSMSVLVTHAVHMHKVG